MNKAHLKTFSPDKKPKSILIKQNSYHSHESIMIASHELIKDDLKHRPSLSFNEHDFKKLNSRHQRTISEIIPFQAETNIRNYKTRRQLPNSLERYINQGGLPILKEKKESSSEDSMSEDERSIRNIITERKSWNPTIFDIANKKIINTQQEILKNTANSRMGIKRQLLMAFSGKIDELINVNPQSTHIKDDFNFLQ